MTQVPVGEVDVLLDELCRRRVLVREWGRTGEIVRFRHALMREAAIDGLLAVHRAELHRQLAALLAQTPGAARPEDLAHHYEAGGDPEHAARCWLEAGRVAAGTRASTEGIAPLPPRPSAPPHLPEGAQRPPPG